MADRQVNFILRLVTDSFGKPLTDARKGFQGFVNGLGGMAKSLGGLLAGLAIGKFLKDAVEEAARAEKSVALLGVSVTNAGGDFGKLRAPLEDAIDGVRRLSVHSDDDLREALTRMITVTGDVAGSTRNLGLAADLAAARNIDLSMAADVVSKAMNGNTTALNRLGIQGANAQEAITNLRTAVSGFAERDAATLSGRLQQLGNEWGEFKEAVGEAIVGTGQVGTSVGGLTGLLAGLGQWVEENSNLIGVWVDMLVTVGGVIGKGLAGAIKVATPWVLRLMEVIGFAIEGIGSLLTVGQNVLRKFGIDVGSALSVTLKDAGQKIQAAAREGYSGLNKTAERGEEELRKTVDLGGGGRVRLSKAELAERKKLQKEIGDEIVALARLQVDATIKLIEQANTAQQKYLKRFPQLKHEAKTALEETSGHLERAIHTVNRAWAEFSRRAEAVTEDSAVRLDRLVSTVTGVARGLLDAASAAGVFGQSLSSGLNSVINLGEALTKIQRGDLLGGVTQGVGALVNLGKTIFGSSDGLKRAIDTNVAKLESLRARMGDLINVMLPGNQLAGVRQALAAVLPQLSGQLGSGEKRALDAALLKQGLTRKQLDEVSEALGIRIRDDKGNLETALLRQLFQALQIADADFADTFAGQRERIRTGVSIGAITDELGELMALITDRRVGVPALAAALQGLDLGSAEGRASGVTALRELFRNIGQVGVSGLGGANRQEFLDVLDQLLRLLAAEAPGVAPTPTPVEPPPAAEGAAATPIPVVAAPLAESWWDNLLAVETTSRDYLQELAAAAARVAAAGPAPVTVTVNATTTINGATGTTEGAIRTALEAQTDTMIDRLEELFADRLRRTQADAGLLTRIA